MEAALVLLASLIITESALNVLQVPSIALPQANVSLFVVKTQFTHQVLTPVSVRQALG